MTITAIETRPSRRTASAVRLPRRLDTGDVNARHASSPDTSIGRELLAISYENLKPMLGMNLVASAGTALVLWYGGAGWALIWLVATVVLAAVRFSLCANITRAMIVDGTPDQSARWHRQASIGLYASAASWAILAALVRGSQPSDVYMVAMILSGLAAGGTGIMASMAIEGRVYIAVMLGSTAMTLFRQDNQGLVMTFLSLVFMFVMVIVHHRNHIGIRQSIDLKNENVELVDDLKALNIDLEQRIEERTEALVNAANSDALTGLPNRRRLLSWMQVHISANNRQEAAVLFLDLDRFKQINDAMGHGVGDRILQAVASRLKTLVPDGALLARWGGDEFVVVLAHGEAVSPRAERIATAMVEAIRQPFEIQGQRLLLGLSVGLAKYPADATTHEALILAADLAVAEVKRQGRGKVLSFCESYAATQKRRFDVSRALAEAIKSEQLALHYQPIFNWRSGTIHGYEALSRWNHPVLGSVSPAEFIPIAEESDGIVALGDMVMRRACTEAVTWATADQAPVVAVNVSVKQLIENDFALRVAQILAETGLPAARLDVEVTESIFADDHIDATRSSIENLRAIGVAVSIDDFGTGYSSLSRLLSLPVTAVKIDKSFVTALSGNGAAVVESTLLIARRLGISVIAEGVETEDQFNRLSAMGVDLFQGYYFGKPCPAAITSDDLRLSISMGSS